MDEKVLTEEELSACITKIESVLGRRIDGLEREIILRSVYMGMELYQTRILGNLAAMKKRIEHQV